MDAVKGTGEIQEIVDAERGEGRGVKCAVVYQTAGFGDDEKCVDDPVGVVSALPMGGEVHSSFHIHVTWQPDTFTLRLVWPHLMTSVPHIRVVSDVGFLKNHCTALAELAASHAR